MLPVPQDQVERRTTRSLEACKRAGPRVTPQRLWIFREVARSDEHPDAETIRRRLPNLSLDTVYRTLRLLEEFRVASAVLADPDRVRYDANPRPHHHFVCTKCRTVRDFDADEVGQLQIPEEVRAWGQVTSTHLEVRGICMQCRGKAARAR